MYNDLIENKNDFIYKRPQDKIITLINNVHNNTVFKVHSNNKPNIDNKYLNDKIKSYFDKKTKHPIYTLKNISLNNLHIKKNMTERKINKNNNKKIFIKDKLLNNKLKKIKLSKPPKLLSYNTLGKKELFPKEIVESKKYLKKIDIE